MSISLKFVIIAFTAIPAAVLLYKIIQTNNFMRFLFGIKKKEMKKNFIHQSSFVNLSEDQLQATLSDANSLKQKQMKLFRDTRQSLIMEKNLKRYLLYALGEILLVDDWY